MQFREDTPVLTADGERLGRVSGVVVDPGGEEVTHLIVEKGLLLEEDKVVDIDLVVEASDEQVLMKEGVSPESLLPFEHQSFIPLGDLTGSEQRPGEPRPMVRYSPRRVVPGYPAFLRPSEPGADVTARSVPPESLTIETGSLVISADSQRVGDVVEVLTDDDTVTGFVIEQGLFLKHEKEVPADWVRTIRQDEVVLKVAAEMVERLPDRKG